MTCFRTRCRPPRDPTRSSKRPRSAPPDQVSAGSGPRAKSAIPAVPEDPRASNDRRVFNGLEVQVVLEGLRAARVPEFAQGFGLDLADSFAGDVEFATDFLQGAGAAVIEPEAQLDNLLF